MIRIWLKDSRSLGSQRIKESDESALGKELSLSLMRNDPNNLGSLIQIRNIPKKRTLDYRIQNVHVEMYQADRLLSVVSSNTPRKVHFSSFVDNVNLKSKTFSIFVFFFKTEPFVFFCSQSSAKTRQKVKFVSKMEIIKTHCHCCRF